MTESAADTALFWLLVVIALLAVGIVLWALLDRNRGGGFRGIRGPARRDVRDPFA